MQGEYDEAEEGTIDVTYGFSKDRRRDLKQIVFGIGANHEGVPLMVSSWGMIRQYELYWSYSYLKEGTCDVFPRPNL
ncbi:MAG: hypothetical protein AB1774_10750, partial [Bacillota bacterium]